MSSFIDELALTPANLSFITSHPESVDVLNATRDVTSIIPVEISAVIASHVLEDMKTDETSRLFPKRLQLFLFCYVRDHEEMFTISRFDRTISLRDEITDYWVVLKNYVEIANRLYEFISSEEVTSHVDQHLDSEKISESIGMDYCMTASCTAKILFLACPHVMEMFDRSFPFRRRLHYDPIPPPYAMIEGGRYCLSSTIIKNLISMQMGFKLVC